MQEAADLLTWQRRSDTPALLRRRYEDLVDVRLRSIAATNEEGGCILESLSMISPERRRAFLRAPQVASRILAARRPDALDAGPIAKALIAELAAAGIVTELAEPVWTALGDKRLVPMLPGASEDVPSLIASTGIVLDGASPIDFSTEATGAVALPASDQRMLVEGRISDAAAGIARSAPHAFAFLKQCIDVVAMRTTTTLQKRMSSNSFLRNARVMLILNGHLDGTGSAAIADAIVHEAIHSLLFMYEELYEPFVPRDSAAEFIVVRSPWSGAELFLSAFVHACIVWYGLYWFWSAAAPSPAWQGQSGSRFRARARAGFAAGPLGSLPAEAHHSISPQTVELLASLERRVFVAEAEPLEFRRQDLTMPSND